MRLHWRNSATSAQARPLDHRLPSDKVSRRRDRPTAWSISAIPTRTEPLGEGGRPEPHAVARQRDPGCEADVQVAGGKPAAAVFALRRLRQGNSLT
jgi:hypothetical protein